MSLYISLNHAINLTKSLFIKQVSPMLPLKEQKFTYVCKHGEFTLSKSADSSILPFELSYDSNNTELVNFLSEMMRDETA